jgi:hypothetical protein
MTLVQALLVLLASTFACKRRQWNGPKVWYGSVTKVTGLAAETPLTNKAPGFVGAPLVPG